jgi:hypothetical protein
MEGRREITQGATEGYTENYTQNLTIPAPQDLQSCGTDNFKFPLKIAYFIKTSSFIAITRLRIGLNSVAGLQILRSGNPAERRKKLVVTV